MRIFLAGASGVIGRRLVALLVAKGHVVATANLLAAADDAGVERLVAQSIAWSARGRTGRTVRSYEKAIRDRGGVVLRYGQFYGPGTYQEFAPSGSAIHIDRAAQETLDHLESPAGVYVIAE